ncbi:MAG: hypothetical protein JXR65_08060 [Bacteroidales bacterium]|nr:hypothetical protein [Bacteroidales bacterium]
MKSIKLSSVVMLALLFAVIPTQSWAKKKISLRYNLEKGSEYTFNIKVDQNMQMKVMSNDVNTNNVITLQQTSKVIDASADQFKFSNTIDKMVMDISSMGMNMHIDSSDPSTYAQGREKMMGEAMNKAIGKSYEITINQLGKITSMDLGNLSTALAALGDKNDQSSFTVYPENKLSEGDSWESTVKAGKGMVVKSKYTLKKISGHTAELSVDGTITSDGSNDKISNLSGIQTGIIYIDINTGMTTKATLNQEIKMDISQSGMTIPSNITSLISLDVKKK